MISSSGGVNNAISILRLARCGSVPPPVMRIFWEIGEQDVDGNDHDFNSICEL
jgi:hypothetical protein